MHRVSPLLRCAAEPVVQASQLGKVVLLTINRPNQLNALNKEVADLLAANLLKYDADPSCAAFVLTGAGRAFVAGADIKMMKDLSFVEFLKSDAFGALNEVEKIKKPIIAAVNGFALGGGCELAMMCDIIIASEKAKFGQPEVTLGTLPGIGGTQRLPRAIGKAKAMEWALTGETYSAEEAERAGLVSRVVKHEELLPTAMKMAEGIAERSQIANLLVKKAIKGSQNTTLQLGLEFEKLMFDASFNTKDCKEGMTAFTEKRKPNFTDE